MRKQILPLPRCQAQPSWSSPVGVQGTLRSRSTERSLLCADMAGQFLDRTHPLIIESCMSVIGVNMSRNCHNTGARLVFEAYRSDWTSSSSSAAREPR